MNFENIKSRLRKCTNIIILLFILIMVAIIIFLNRNELLRKIGINTSKYEIEEIRQNIETSILNIEEKEKGLGNEITVESILQELLENEIFETIDKEDKTGYTQEYEVKLKFNNENKVVIDQIETVSDVKVTYNLYPKTYTQKEKIDILFKVEGKVKSVTKPDGLIIYPKQNIVAMDYYVTANGKYKFIVEKEDGNKEEKNVIVDTIDMLPPEEFEITTEKTRTGMKINAKTQDSEANETSVTSGIRKYEYYIKISTEKEYQKYDTNEINNLLDGIYDVYVIAYDKAGNATMSNKVTQEVEGWIEIWNEQDLRDVANNLTRNHIVMADIEVQNEWNAIGDNSNRFNANLEGNGHKITGIRIEDTSSNYHGLFGYIGEKGKISNLELECNIVTNTDYIGGITGVNCGTIENVKANVSIIGNTIIGGIVGNNRGVVRNAEVNGTISGMGNVGGIIGTINNGCLVEKACNMATVNGDGNNIGGIAGTAGNATISKIANIGTIKGSYNIGGIVGTLGEKATIVNAYSIGSITVTSQGINMGIAGGIAGNSLSTSTIMNTYSISQIIGSGRNLQGISNRNNSTNSYFAAEHAKISRNNVIGTATTIKWLTSKENLEGIFDFENVWDIKDGETLPYFKEMPIPDEVYIEKQGYITMDGEGTLENPYLICTEEQLKNVNYYLTSYFKLMNNIELENEWTPISAYNSSMGSSDYEFQGDFDGNGYKISNLAINNNTSRYLGMFGYIGKSGKVHNLDLECNISGTREVGAIAGINSGTIENVKVEGNVVGTSVIGGIVGDNRGTILKSYSSAEVTASNSYAGGIAGDNQGTIEKVINTGKVNGGYGIGGIVGRNRARFIITNSYSIGNITGTTGFTGGIAGYNEGSVINTYSLSKISGGNSARGLIGSNTGTVTNSYWTVEKAEVDDKNNGGTAVTLEQMKIQSTYEDWDFEDVWVMKEYPELRWNS